MFQIKPIPTHHTLSMNTKSQLISLSCHFHNQPSHDFNMSNSFKFIIHNPYTLLSMHIHFPSGHYIIIHSYTSQTSKNRNKTPHQNAHSPSSSLKLKGLAQARGSLAQASSLRLGESSTHRNNNLHAFSHRRASPRLSEMLARSKTELVAWATPRVKRVWASPCLSRLSETGSLGEIIRFRHCFPATAIHTSPDQHAQTFQAFITSHQPHNLKITAEQQEKNEIHE